MKYTDDLVKSLTEQAITDPNQFMVSMSEMVTQAMLRHLYSQCNAMFYLNLAKFELVVTECCGCKK